MVAGWCKCQTGETKSAFRSTRASWQAMLVQMFWGFQFVECLKQFERKISFSILSNILKMKNMETRHGKQKFRPNAVMQKAAEATGVPLRTLQRLSNGNSESKKIKSKKAKLSRETFGKLDDFDLGVIRRLIHQFYLRNESPTLDKILKELKEKMDFPYGRSRLHKLLKKMGFCFKFRGKERLIYEPRSPNEERVGRCEKLEKFKSETTRLQ